MTVKKQNTLNRTQRQQLRTRRQLLDAGRSLIAEKGVSGLRVQEVTELADVALGSFYNYYSSKDDLVAAIIAESLSDLVSAIVVETSADTDPAETVADATIRVVGLAHSDPALARLIVNIPNAESLFGQTLSPHARIAVERGIATGRFNVPDVDVLLTSVIGGAFALIREILNGRHGLHAAEAFACYALASLGVRPDEALAIVNRTVKATSP